VLVRRVLRVDVGLARVRRQPDDGDDGACDGDDRPDDEARVHRVDERVLRRGHEGLCEGGRLPRDLVRVPERGAE